VCGLLPLISAAGVRADLGVPVSPPAALNTSAAGDTGMDIAPHFATDNNGNWVAVWSSNENLGAALGADYDIFVSRSVDNGANWSNPTPLNNNAAADDGDDRSPRIATDANGNWMVTWSSTDKLGDTIGSDSDILFARSIDNGANWSSPLPLNTNASGDGGSDTTPSIAADTQGNWVVVWMTNGLFGSDLDVVSARSNNLGATWTAPASVKTTAATDGIAQDESPAIATDGQGRWLVVWESNDPLGGTIGVDYDILVARSDDNGANWTPAVPANSNAAGDTAFDAKPNLATDAAGNWVAVWENKSIFAARSIDNGANWSSPLPIDNFANRDSYYPAIATDRNGNWAVIWASIGFTPPSTYDYADFRVHIARSIDSGANWSSPSPAAPDPGEDEDGNAVPAIAADSRGQWIAAWGATSPPGGILGPDLDLRIVRLAIPDCNGNLIGDPLETAAGISPDINNNGRPDFCEVLGLPPAGGGCGGGLCGVGAAAFGPLTILSIAIMRRPTKRRREGA